MSPPRPGRNPAPPAVGVNQEVPQQEGSAYLSTRTLVREARKFADSRGYDIQGARLRRLVRQYVRSGRADIDFRTWFIAYADPTGETAVRNVMRAGGGLDGAA